MWLHICFYERRLYGTLPGDCHGATNTVASRNDIIAQRAFYNGASAEMFRLHFVPLNILTYALVSPVAREGIDARAFAANTAARLRT